MPYNSNIKSIPLPVLLNTLGILGISFVLLIAFYYQIVYFELPCPLCLLQRVGLIVAGCGFLLNIQNNIRPAHYSIVLIGAILTGIVSTRQILLHIMPDNSGYGSSFLGLHFYTWTLVISVILLFATSLMLAIIDLPFNNIESSLLTSTKKFAALLFIVLIVANLLSTILQCGIGQCEANPTSYLLLPV